MESSYAESLHNLRRAMIATLRAVKLTQLRKGFSHEQLIPVGSYAPWVDDSVFVALYERIRGHTLVDIYRCYELWDLSKQLRAVPGDILEVGVWKGGTAAIIGKAASETQPCHLWLADTFGDGVPKAGAEDTRYKGGEHADTSEAIVLDLLHGLGISNCTLLRGVFPEQTGQRMDGVRIKLCHIDVDTYQSAWDVFNWVWPRTVPGGIVVFDDYGFWGCEGVTSAVNEMKAAGHRVIYNLNGHALICRNGGPTDSAGQ